MKTAIIDLEALKGKVFTSESVAELLKLAPDSIRRRIRNGQIPARKVPGEKSYAISGDDLVEYLLGTPTKHGAKRAILPAAPRNKPALIDPSPLPFKLPKTAIARLKAWMTKQGKTQKDISLETGLNGGELSRILNGKRALTNRNAERLRAAYGDELINSLVKP